MQLYVFKPSALQPNERPHHTSERLLRGKDPDVIQSILPHTF